MSSPGPKHTQCEWFLHNIGPGAGHSQCDYTMSAKGNKSNCCLSLQDSIYYRPQRSWGKVMFLQASVILFTGGGSTWHPPEQTHTHPLGADTPPDQVHPLSRHPPGSRHTLMQEQTPPWEQTHTPPSRHPPKQTHTPRDQVHPPEQTPPQEQTPPRADTPPVQSMLGDTVNMRAVRILLECNLVTISEVRFTEYFNKN